MWKQLLVELLIGALSGFVANTLMQGKGNSVLLNIILGLVGGVIGGFLGNLIGIGGGWVTGILLSIGGACLVVWLYRKIFK